MRHINIAILGAFSLWMLPACETAPIDAGAYSPPASNHHKLAGTSWVWETDLEQDPTIKFLANGHIGGFTGCNQVGGVFEETADIKDGRHLLKMSEVFSTEMACPTAMETERTFIQAITTSESFKKSSSDALVLFDRDGKEVLRLTKQLR